MNDSVIIHLLAQPLGSQLERPMNAWVVEPSKILPKWIPCEQSVLEAFSCQRKPFNWVYSSVLRSSHGWGLADFPSYKYDVLGFFLVKLTSVTTLPTISNTPYGTLKNISAPPFFPVLTVKLG